MLPLIKRKTRLLLLDDDPSMQRLIALLLRRSGYRVDVVGEASAAIRQVAKVDYGVLLLDLMTPTEGGMTVIRHLREHNPELLGRVILVTGMPDSVLKSVAGEGFTVVHKPFEPETLKDAIARLIGTSVKA